MLRTFKLRSLARQRRAALADVTDARLRKFLSAPLDTLRAPWSQQSYLALDIETTGLDANVDHAVSFGWVPIVEGRIVLAKTRRILVRLPIEMNNSATVHGLRDQDLAAGVTLETALDAVIEALTQRVLIVHYAGLDKRLLDRLCTARYGVPLLVPTIDTLALAQRFLRHTHIKPTDLRLASLSERFGLPMPAQHDALNDALATAQVFLALVAQSRGGTPTSADLVSV